MKLTVEQIEDWREALSRTYGQSAAPEMIEALKDVNALCDAALSAKGMEEELVAIREVLRRRGKSNFPEFVALRQENIAMREAIQENIKFLKYVEQSWAVIPMQTIVNIRVKLENAIKEQSLNPKNEEVS